jgi:hypothetical protein
VHASRLRAALTALSLLAAVAPAAARLQEAPPDPADVMRRVREAARLDDELQSNFTYIEQRRDVKVSILGKVTVGPLRTFEVYPSSQAGTYKRLIAIDGKPLPPAELERRDAEHQKNLREEAERRRRETPAQRQAREADETRERRERQAKMDDAFAVYTATFVGRERLEGERMLVFDITPREDARVTTREGRWMKQFAGRIWISEPDYQIAKLDMRALDDVTIGWGIVGRVHAGSRFVFSRRKFQDTWLPAEVVFDGTGRTLLFRKFQIHAVTTYSGYKRVAPSQ